MLGWLRKFGDRITYQTPPHEPPAAERIALPPTPSGESTPWEREAIGDIWVAIDRAFREESARGASVRDTGRLDLAMEIRNILVPPRKPTVPVVPGPDRFELSADYYGENPW